jgi:hypothetical protein
MAPSGLPPLDRATSAGALPVVEDAKRFTRERAARVSDQRAATLQSIRG